MSRRPTPKPANPAIKLLETVRILNDHLTEELCAQVFESTRTTEREREWSLFSLMKFWTAVILIPSSRIETFVVR